MAGLSDILNIVRGQDPDEQKRIARRAQQFENTTGGGGAQPTEPGIEQVGSETDYDKTQPVASTLPFIGGLGKAASSEAVGMSGAGRNPLSQVSQGLRESAVRSPSVLSSVAENPAAAQEAYDFQQKALRAGAQKLKDVASGARRVGGQIAPGEELNYAKMNRPSLQATSDVPVASSMDYTRPSGSTIRDLQEQMQQAQGLGTAEGYQEARRLQDVIRKAREGISVTPRVRKP